MNRTFALLFLGLLSLAGCRSAAVREPVRESDALPRIVQLTRDYEDAAEPVLSADARWIAFRAIARGEDLPALYVAPVAHADAARRQIEGLGTAIRITPAGSRSTSPTFSPDTRTLVFTSNALDPVAPLETAPDGTPRRPPPPASVEASAEVFRVDDWQRNIAAADPRKGVDLTVYPLTRNASYDGEPAFSPDGRHVAFASDRDAPRSALITRPFVDVYVMSAEGIRPVRITTEHGYDGQPAFSPDGTMLVFASEREQAARHDLYVVRLQFDAAGRVTGAGPAKRLTRSGNNTNPVFHPDGDRVLYAGDRADRRGDPGAKELRQVAIDGTSDLRLTYHAASDDEPAISADGRYLVFSSNRTPDGTRQLFLADYRTPRGGRPNPQSAPPQ